MRQLIAQYQGLGALALGAHKLQDMRLRLAISSIYVLVVADDASAVFSEQRAVLDK